LKLKDRFQSYKHDLINLRHSVQNAAHWKRISFENVPAIFGNAMPKSGSHLVIQILEGLSQVAPFRYVSTQPIRMVTAQGRVRSETEIRRNLKALHSGAIGWGYLRSEPWIVAFFVQNTDVIPFFVHRDPRDVIISSIFYAVDMHMDHAQHDFYSSIEMDERIKFAIKGRQVEGLAHLPTIRVQYDRYLAWLDCPSVLCLRFEDLIQNSDQTLERLLAHLVQRGVELHTSQDEALAIIKDAIQPKNSPTFRKGSVGGWREHFNDDHIQLFKNVSGDLLVRLGYEEDDAW
jgi:sulfotransferase 6B1